MNAVGNGLRTLTPHLIVRDALAAIEYYKNAFGAEEISRLMAPDGSRLWHVELRIGDSPLFIAEEMPTMGSNSPQSLGGSSVIVHVYVNDVDTAFVRAVAAGGKAKLAPTDMFWGDRYCRIQDPFGHEWAIATKKETLTSEQVGQRAREFFEKMPKKS